MLELEVLKKVTPVGLRASVTQELVDKVNSAAVDPEMARLIEENTVSFTNVLKTGKYKLTDYVNAVSFVSHQMAKSTNIDAYVKTFPDRYTALVARGVSPKDISSYVAAYNRNKLVNEVREAAMIPITLLNHHKAQEALNVLCGIMNDSDATDRSRIDAASSVLLNLKMPEKQEVEISVGIVDNTDLRDLKVIMGQMAEKQLNGSMDAKEIAHSRIVIDHEDVVDV